jgi:aldehyde dehydrogenase (NAD+)
MNQYQPLLDRQLANFNSDVTKTYEWRMDQLDRMERMLKENIPAFEKAIGSDFKTAYAEQYFETRAPIATIAGTRMQLKDWMKPIEMHPIPKFLEQNGYKGMVYREPYGVTLVIGPSNGPLLLSLRPAINAIAAGNPVVLTTSDALPGTTKILLDLIPKYFDPASFTAVAGGREANTELLKLPWSFIFFTGSVPVGKVIMRAAAENLIPVILELGGQNPAIVDETADIADAAKKIVWGAMAWGGQWCTSPGYAIVHESVVKAFVAEAKKALLAQLGPDPRKSPDYSKIISVRELKRLFSLIDKDKVVIGGQFDEAERYLAPTLIYPVQWTDKIMDDEIFGPILPILTYSDLPAVVSEIKRRPKPLSAYFFSTSNKNTDYLINSISFGGGAVNEVNITLYIETMPFGGVGSSGIGNYYGKWGFDTLTHAKSVLVSPADKEISHLIPPYDKKKVEGLNLWFAY